MSAKRAAAWLFVAGLVAASCGGGSDDGGGGAAGGGGAERGRGGREPVDFFGEEESGIGAELAAARAESPDGLLPTDVALDLFASVYGEVPGGEARFDDVRPHDGSLAIGAVGTRWGELDEQTRAAIQERLAAGEIKASDTLVAPAQFGRSVGGVDEDVLALWARASVLSDEISEHLGYKRGKPIDVAIVAPSAFPQPTMHADAGPVRDRRYVFEGDYDSCRIRVNEEVEHTDALLAHEVFHCYQFELTSPEQVFSLPHWIREGSAAWAAVTVAGADNTHRDFFVEFQRFTKSLYKVDYVAIGYFFTIETMGIDPWDDIPRLLSSSDKDHAVHHSELDRKQLISRMGTGAFLRSVDGTSVDDIWDLSPEPVPQASRDSGTISRSSPFEASGQFPSFVKSPAQQIDVAGDALDVELTAEVGAVQEVGGALETFEGEYSNRFCFEEGDARIVFLNLAIVDPGTMSVKLSVPSEDEADECEPEPEPSASRGCPYYDFEIVFPPTLPLGPEHGCPSEADFLLPGIAQVVYLFVAVERDESGHQSEDVVPSEPPSCDFGTCADVSQSLPGGSIKGGAQWFECPSRPYDDNPLIRANGSVGFNAAIAPAPGYPEVRILGYTRWAEEHYQDCGTAEQETTRTLYEVAAAIRSRVGGIGFVRQEPPERR